MNKIFKRIWNRKRGCWVVASELAVAISKKAKLSIVVGMALTSICSEAASVYDGDWYKGTQNGRNGHEHPYGPETTINGNFYFDPLDVYQDLFVVADNDGKGGSTDCKLTINGSLYHRANQKEPGSEGSRWFGVARSDASERGHGILVVRDNVELTNKSWFVGASNNRREALAEIYIGGRFYIQNGSAFRLAENTASSGGVAKASLNANELLLEGTFHAPYNAGRDQTTEVSMIFQRGIIQNGGFFEHNGSNGWTTAHFQDSLTVGSGGRLENVNSVIVGSSEQGHISVGNVLTLSGGTLAYNADLTQLKGTVNVSSGSYVFNTYRKDDGVLNNSGYLTAGVFNQSNGSVENSGEMTIGSSDLHGFLNNPGTLNLTGNIISRGNLTSSGILNNRGNWTETAHYAISGSLNNSGAVNFQNGFEFAANGRLNSSGTLQTNNAANIFDSLGSQGQTALSTVSLQAVLPEETKTALTDLFRHYVPGTVAQSLIDHATFTGRKVIVTGVNLTTTQRDDLVQAFKAKFFRVLGI